MSAQSLSIVLSRTGPSVKWGFRLKGGKDFGTALSVDQVTGGSVADQQGLVAGDFIVSINGTPALFTLLHHAAQSLIRNAGNRIEFELSRGGLPVSADSSYVNDRVEYVTSLDDMPSSPRLTSERHPSLLNSLPSPFTHDNMEHTHTSLAANWSNKSPKTSYQTPQPPAPQPPAIKVESNPTLLYAPSAMNRSPSPNAIPDNKTVLTHTIQFNRPSTPTNPTPAANQSSSPNPSQTYQTMQSNKPILTHQIQFNRPAQLTNPMQVNRSVSPNRSTPTNQIQANKPLPSSSLYTNAAAPRSSSPSNLQYKPPSTLTSNVTGDLASNLASQLSLSKQQSLPRTPVTPVCTVCREIVKGSYYTTSVGLFCEDHFKCFHCSKSLLDIEFAEKQGQLYCAEDFRNIMAEICASCSKPILDKMVNALNRTWHTSCFLCLRCRGPIVGDSFNVTDDQQPVCDDCWEKHYQINCASCHKAIGGTDRFLELKGANYHSTCLRCSVCRGQLEGKIRMNAAGHFFCVNHTPK